MAAEVTTATDMVRFECGQCDMQVTMVCTMYSDPAWRDHMRSHHDELDFREWRWTVVPLDFGTPPVEA